MSAGSGGRRTMPASSVVLLAGGRRLVLSGRQAALLVEVALAAAEIGAVGFGVVHLDLTPARVRLRVERLHQPLHIGSVEDAGERD